MVTEIDGLIKTTQQKLKGNNNASSGAGAAGGLGGLDLGSLASMFGGAGGGANGGTGGLDFGALMQSPMVQQMMQGMMGGANNANMMGDNDDEEDEDYDDEDDQDSGDDGNDRTDPAANPLAGLDMNSPQIQNIMQQVQQNPAAAMQYLNNPEIMAAIGPLMQQMMGGMAGSRR